MDPVEIDMHWLNEYALQMYPSCIAQMVILLESIRTVPAELRMYRRALKRKRFNAAEMMFLGIKYIAIVAWCCDAVVQNTDWPTSGEDCLAIHSISYFFQFFAVTGVAMAISWRTYVVYHCSRKAYWLLIAGLMGHVALSMWTAYRQPKATYLLQGFCNVIPPPPHSIWTFSVVWYLIYNVLFDSLVTGFATWRLLVNSRQLSGFSHISKVLFINNIHYVIIVCGANFSELIYMLATNGETRSLIGISLAIQIITGLNMLIREQDFVHDKAPSRLMRGDSGMPNSVTPPSKQPLRYHQTTMSSVPCQRSTMGDLCTDKLHDCGNCYPSLRSASKGPFAGITYDLDQSCSQGSLSDPSKTENAGVNTWSPSWDVTNGRSMLYSSPTCIVDQEKGGALAQTVHVSYPTLDRRAQLSPNLPQSTREEQHEQQQAPTADQRTSMWSVKSASSRTLRAKLNEKNEFTSISKMRTSDEHQLENGSVIPLFEISAGGCLHASHTSGLLHPNGPLHTVDASTHGSMASHVTFNDESRFMSVPQYRTNAREPVADAVSTSTDASFVASTFGGRYRGNMIHGPPSRSPSDSQLRDAIQEEQRSQCLGGTAQADKNLQNRNTNEICGAGSKETFAGWSQQQTDLIHRMPSLANSEYSSGETVKADQRTEASDSQQLQTSELQPSYLSPNAMGSPPRTRRIEHEERRTSLSTVPRLSVSSRLDDAALQRSMSFRSVSSAAEHDIETGTTTVMSVTPGRWQTQHRAAAQNDDLY